MPEYNYYCPECGREYEIHKGMSEATRAEFCDYDNSPLRRRFEVNIMGTRDAFGINKSFVDETTGKEITTWKEWEKAGYRDPMDSPNLSSDMKAGIKRKVEKVRKYDSGKKTHVAMSR